jgi:hypothetical protein
MFPSQSGKVIEKKQGNYTPYFSDYYLSYINFTITNSAHPPVLMKGWYPTTAVQRYWLSLDLYAQFFEETNHTMPWVRWHPVISGFYLGWGVTTGTVKCIRGTFNISTNASFQINGFSGLHIIHPDFTHQLIGFCLELDFWNTYRIEGEF